MAGESRTDLLNWLNSLLGLNYKKVEECGTGAAYCQILDSIYGDVPMTKVKYEAKQEYELLINYKVLQQTFLKKKIERPVPVDKLIKCRFQDNLEFLQWMKKFWMENKDESDYDADSRRLSLNKARTTPLISSINNSSTGVRSTRVSSTPVSSAPVTTTNRRVSSRQETLDRSISNPRSRVSSVNGNVASTTQTKMLQLQKELTETKQDLNATAEELNEYKVAAEGLETERNFYFNKLREIEILTQNTNDLIEQSGAREPVDMTMEELLKQVQEILYSTEEGFRVPDQEQDALMIDEETF